MLPVLILQNCTDELAGSVFDYFDNNNQTYKLVKTFESFTFPELEEISAIICLGCPQSITDLGSHEQLKQLYEFVTKAVRENFPYLGICFGGQLLAKILGAIVEPNKIKEIGTYEVTLTESGKTDPIFANFPDKFPVFHWHGDTFRIPFGSERLAEGTDCRNQAFRRDNMVAVQFHLEPNPNEVSHWCDVYKSEMDNVGQTKTDICSKFDGQYEDIKKLNFQLLDNFFNLIK